MINHLLIDFSFELLLINIYLFIFINIYYYLFELLLIIIYLLIFNCSYYLFIYLIILNYYELLLLFFLNLTILLFDYLMNNVETMNYQVGEALETTAT